MKTCTGCKLLLPLDRFNIRRWKTARGEIREGKQARCRPCWATYAQRIERKSEAYKLKMSDPVYRLRKKRRLYENHLKRVFGITCEDWARMYDAQRGCCAICHQRFPDDDAHVDHCHETGKVRGLLCINCNMAIGLLRESVSTLQSAIIYVSNASSNA